MVQTMNEPQSKPAYSEAAKTLSPALIAVAVLLVAVIGIEIWTWIFADSNAEEIAFRSGVVRNMGLLAVGVIGLPLAIWRSYTAHKQAEEAAKQGARTDRQLQLTLDQMKITTESNHADLLERSAALLGLDDEQKCDTAVSFLTTLGEDNNSTYAPAARVLLGSIISGKECIQSQPFYIERTLHWLEKYCKKNNTTYYLKDLRFETVEGFPFTFPSIGGITYVGGYYTNMRLKTFGCTFENAYIADTVFDTTVSLLGSVGIKLSRIRRFPKLSTENSQVFFVECDFTDCNVFPPKFLRENISLENCYYLHSLPPNSGLLDKIGTKLDSLSDADYAARIKDMYAHRK